MNNVFVKIIPWHAKFILDVFKFPYDLSTISVGSVGKL